MQTSYDNNTVPDTASEGEKDERHTAAADSQMSGDQHSPVGLPHHTCKGSISALATQLGVAGRVLHAGPACRAPPLTHTLHRFPSASGCFLCSAIARDGLTA